MIPFEEVGEPADFDRRTRQPGNLWLEENPAPARPRDYWSPFKGNLAGAFRNLCAYTAMFEPIGTVDHFVSCNEDRGRAYDWTNYRFASGWINSSKSRLESGKLLDPFDVEDGWFRILLPSLQLVVDKTVVPPEFVEKAVFVLSRLHLRDDERVLRQRREWYRMYQEKELTFEGLLKKAPLIAQAVESAAVH